MSEPGAPKVEFALGSEVSPGHFFKSSFARSFVTSASAGGCCRDSKSLDGDPEDEVVAGSSHHHHLHQQNGNFYSLVNFAGDGLWSNGQQQRSGSGDTPTLTSSELNELEKLRKQCQSLTEENERLRNQHSQVIDSVYLQNQVETLQWQLKQSEANRHMYRSLMEQVARFLERARKSLDIIHEKSGPKSARSASGHQSDKSRVPRSRSVHAVHNNLNDDDHSDSPVRLSCASSTTSSSSASSSTSSSSSRFGRAKSVAQISPNSSAVGGSSRDITWSVLRRNELGPPRSKPPPPPPPSIMAGSKSVQDVNVQGAYRRPKQSEIDPDDVPPEKLAQEAFRLMRTVQSLLVMREPDLTRLGTSVEPQTIASSPTTLDHGGVADSSLTLTSNFANSTCLQEAGASSSSDRGSSSCTDDEVNRTVFSANVKMPSADAASTTTSPTATMATKGGGAAQLLSPGARQSIDASSLNSGSSKNTTEDEDAGPGCRPGFGARDGFAAPTSSTPNGRVRPRKTDRKELHLKSLRDWALGNSGPASLVAGPRPKPAPSVSSSAEDESGFSSMSSFQEVGLPNVCGLSPIKAVGGGGSGGGNGCHTEIGLPEVPLDKVRHRRWSSTPAEFQALVKRHSAGYPSSNGPNESLSVWV